MARDGNGSYSLPEAAFVYDTVIDETAVNSNFSDIASALTASIAKDGQTVPSANLPMGTYKHTGVGNASARDQYAAMGQVQDGSGIWCGTAGGTADAITLTPSPAIPAYAAGQRFEFKAGGASNTGAVTFAISGLSTITGQVNGAACVAGDIVANQWYRITLSDANTAQVERIGSATGDVSGPASSTADALVLFNGTGGKTIKDSTYTITAAGAALLDDANAAAQRTTLGLGTAAVLASDTDTTLAANSDSNVATQKAVKTYADTKLPLAGGALTGAVNMAKGADIASATTTDIGAATGNYVVVTGTTTITGLGTVAAGTQRKVKFSGALTLTHNATSLILPGGASITTAAGDQAEFVSLGSGNWVCTSYVKASGLAIVSAGSAWTYVSSLTLNAASNDFTGLTSGYDYMIVVDSATANATGTYAGLRVQTGGSTWQTTNYRFSLLKHYHSGDATQAAFSATTAAWHWSDGNAAKAHIPLMEENNAFSSANTDFLHGEILLLNPAQTDTDKIIQARTHFMQASGARFENIISGTYNSTTAVTGVRLMQSDGTSSYSSGTARIYKRSHT